MNASQKSEARKFWKDAYLVALREMVNGNGWKTGDTHVSDVQQRSNIAKSFADEAVRNLEKYQG